MDRFDDVSVVASVDETPPEPSVPRGVRRAFTVAIASIVVAGALAGAAVGLASEKPEPSASAPSAVEGAPFGKHRGGCHRGAHHLLRPSQSAGSARY